MQRTFCKTAVSVGLAVILLAACGESDLVAQHERELDDARQQVVEAPDSGAANPDTSDGNDGGNDSGNDGGAVERLDLDQYELVFADDFRGTSIDPLKWNTAMSWGPDLRLYNQQQYYVDTQNAPDFGYDPFTLTGEELIIKAIETPDGLRAAANEQGWLSGALTTLENFEFTYGYVEARIDLPSARGAWPAFWMLGSDFVGVKPELFIMEHDGDYADSVFFNYNYLDQQGTQREFISKGIADGFHQFGVAWSPGELLFYVDRIPRYRVVGDAVSRQDMYLILNLAMGGDWLVDPDGTTGNAVSMVVDYVRAYQLRQ